MSKKKALGQGLDALLGGEIDLDNPDAGGTSEAGVLYLPIGKLIPNPDQPRERFDENAIAELAESIKQQGVIQPILAEERQDGNYLIVAGERRWRASRLAGLEEMPVLVRVFSKEQKLEIALVENVQREDLTAMEEARAYYHLMEALNLSQQEVADKVGKKRSTVANSLRLLKLPENMKASVEEGTLSAGHARALLSVTNPADQELLFSRIVEKTLSVRDAEAMATEMNRGHRGSDTSSKTAKTPAADRNPEFEKLEEELIRVLGTKVSLRGTMAKGKMEVCWYNRDDLNRLYELLVSD